MASIEACELPHDALLRRYLDRGAYADCYVTEVARPVRQAEYVEAFYTTAVFKLERRLLSWLIARPSTDAEAAELASGGLASFAAWNVAARETNQILLSDIQGRTCSWLMSAPASSGRSTTLYFGSAVVPVVNIRSGEKRMGFAFRALLGFHKLYSRLLLRAAARRLARGHASSSHAIVPATVGDATTILDIQRRAFAEEGRRSDNREIPPLTESLDAVIEHIHGQTVLTARDGSRIIGSVRGILAGTGCTIRGLSIEPAHQGRGIGSSLLQAIENAHPQVTHFELTTNTVMESNVRFYERHGYRITELTRYSDKITLAQMRKSRGQDPPLTGRVE